MISRLRNDEPSFSSMNEKSFESRRVRTHPCTRTASIGALLRNASFNEVGERCVILEIATFNAQRPTLNFQIAGRHFGVGGHVRAFKAATCRRTPNSTQRQPVARLRRWFRAIESEVSVFLEEPLVVRKKLHRIVWFESIGFDGGIDLGFEEPH